jgi:hypothetical protein
VAKEKMQQWEVLSNYWGKEIGKYEYYSFSWSCCPRRTSQEIPPFIIHNVYLYGLNSPPLVAILTQSNSATLFTHFSTPLPNIVPFETVMPKKL